ncbi:hypothetical protein N7523_000034 [Penicillium sp. IBT 18751x]|nr:hypothetical protein N7523_000034 [Penicillium sp. IBT 18751x]
MPFLPFSHIVNLRKELNGTDADISTWGCDDYDSRIKQWNDSSDTEVGAVVRITSAEEAATVVRFATCYGVPLAIKSGGCSTSGASTTHGGIVLDLSNLRKVHVNPATRVVVAQGGALWEDIDVASAQHGLAVVGSTLNQIGAAGATLGGGYGWLTGQHGLAIDNLLWARMILADGSIVTASDEQHKGLFWAIRGAGQSFGVAVELAFRAHKQDHPVFAGTLLFSPDVLPSIVQFTNRFETLNDGKQGLLFGFIMQPSMSQCSIFVALFYNGDKAAGERFFSPLVSLGPISNDLQMIPYDGVNGLLNLYHTLPLHETTGNFDIAYPVDNSAGPRKSLSGSNVTLPLEVALVQSIYHIFNQMLKECPQARDSKLLFEILPNTEIMKVSNESMAFASRGPYFNVSSLFRWYDAHLDEGVHLCQRNLMKYIGEQAGIFRKSQYSASKHGVGLYANYAGRDLPIEALFGPNLVRLRELKKTYDPQNTFRHWHNLEAVPETPG